jgi:hypothetical protein
MSTSYTFTGSDTYSVSDVKAVMQNTYEDIMGFANRGIISYQCAKHWINELTYVLNEKVVKFFQVQLYDPAGSRYKSYHYDVDSYGYLSTGSMSGGISYYSFPDGTTAALFVEFDFSKSNAASVNEEVKLRGWGVGTSMEGTASYERTYISNNLQLKRSVITK